MRGPVSPLHLITFVLLLLFLMVFVQFGLVTLAFGKLGLTTSQGMLLLFASLFGSVLNLPVTSIKAEHPNKETEKAMQRGLLRIPQLPFTGRTIVAVNVGGCMVPLVFSASLIHGFTISWPNIGLAVLLCAGICYAISRPVAGIGIGMPMLIAPLAAAIVALAIGGKTAAPLAYIAGTTGVIIGADLLHLKDIAKLGAPVVSIGGAGTFDGI
ncbi:MAG TPA: DUF1614 domain-containing protein, partial [Mariprofundaceae bacterium]|nr:DUF1614 domain-containing protein [Mariprofundaceae bacterium]